MGGALGPRRFKLFVAPEYERELPTATPAQVETSPCPAGLPALGPPWHKGIQMLLPLPPQSPTVPIPIRIPPCSISGQRVHKIRGGDGTLASCSSFCSSCQKQWGNSNVLRTVWSPGPLAGGHRVPSERHYLSGRRGQSWLTSTPGASAPGRHLAAGGCGRKTLAGPCPGPGQGPAALPGSQPGSWQGSLWPSPAQRGPAGDCGNQKVLLEEDEPQQVGAAGACSCLACVASPRGRQRSLAEGAGMGTRVLCSSDWRAQGVMWGEMARPDAWVPFPALGKSLG